MESPLVTMEVRGLAGDSAVVDIKGEVTSTCEPILMGAYEQAERLRARRLILNFSDLEYMNSGGIGMLVTLLVRAKRQRQELAAFGLTEHYRQIFSLTRLDEAITIYDDESAAVGTPAAS